MFMRLLHVKIKPERLEDLRVLYDERVIPALQQTPGCLYACLIQSVQHANECVSMTLWETAAHAEQYTRGEVFQALLSEAKPLFAETSEWKIQLNTDMKLEFQPVPEEPVVESLQVAAEPDTVSRPGVQTPIMYLRVFSMKVLPERHEEFTRLYTAEIVPALLGAPGCCYAYLTESISDRNECFSITIWDSKESADAYEASGLFGALKERLKHTFSDLVQWKMGLSSDQSVKTVTSEDVSVYGYTFVTGKSFR